MQFDECVKSMVSPSERRPGKWMEGVMQIHLTRACDLACSNCTQGSQFAGKKHYMTLENFELACRSLKNYFGLIGIFGGNPAMHPRFPEICEILRSHFPKEKCGLWCNNPFGHAAVMRQTFNPSMSNLNVHLSQGAYDAFKQGWPESRPFGLEQDSRHSPVHGNLLTLLPEDSDVWGLVSKCDINRHWSAMIGEFRGEPRGWFCEVAGGQAMLFQHQPDYPDTGVPIICEDCEGTGVLTDYDGGTVQCGTCSGIAWWRRPMEYFSGQVARHCANCLVPLRGIGNLAQKESVTTITKEYAMLGAKRMHTLNIVDGPIPTEDSRLVIQYLGK